MVPVASLPNADPAPSAGRDQQGTSGTGAAASAGQYVEVALPLPLFHPFTYVVDAAPRHPLLPGTRVVVPFRNRKAIGICVATGSPPPERGIAKAVLDVPDAEPALDGPMLALCRWIADYYAVPLGVALRTALPALLTGAAAPIPARKTHRIAVLSEDEPSLLLRDQLFARAPRQREVIDYLASVGGRSPVGHLTTHLGCSPAVVRALADRGLVRIVDEVIERDPFSRRDRPPAADHTPSPAQRAAIDALTAAAPGGVCLLHGVTGSGKTLVYIELLREIVDRRGQSAMVLVPEIALTPQTVDRFRAVFGDRVAVLHSALSDGERYDAWLALRSGAKRIAVGARSAIFAPLRNLGAIIVDEEHEASYKQGESPRYHVREVAIVRARHAGALTVLGSATPSLESWSNATSGKYRLLTLPDRVGGGRLPSVEVVDLRRRVGTPSSALAAAVPTDQFASVISPSLESALRETLARGEQSIVLLNRRGYASFVQCEACGDVAACPHCSITLTYHRTPERLVCHYCQHHEAPHAICGRCRGSTLRRRGMGTQQVERLLAERFPAARLARMDLDTTSGKWAHAEILDRVGRGEVDILLGTQMIAKGLDFANVTLVGVIDADVGINLPDFRASERCFQLLSQVAGRAGRGPKGGRVFIQTRLPGHHAVQCAVAHDYGRFVETELAGRSMPPYPPVARLANIIFSGTNESATAALAEDGSAWVRRLMDAREIPGIQVIGPAPCPVERIKNRWRWHVLLKSRNAGALTRVGQYFVRRFAVPARDGLRVAFDRDPVALL
jgi:primosomal protein N' (replication factor Y) (superfamily II helicase)